MLLLNRDSSSSAAGDSDDGWPPDLVKHLLELHWNRQHHAFLITYRPVFMRDMRCGGKGFSRLLLNSVSRRCATLFNQTPTLTAGMTLPHQPLSRSSTE